jgi:hypothetical protein
MFKRVMVGGILILGLAGCSDDVVVEVHEIISIDKGEIRGENVNGSGEGIFYYDEDFMDMGLYDTDVGDRVKISWTRKDFDDENWENIYSLEKKSKFFRENIYDNK